MALRPRYEEREPLRHNEYFLEREGISREVIQADICRYLGNDALVRTGTHQGRQGYFIRAYRNLTSEMITDLKTDSTRWETEATRRELQGFPRGRYVQELNILPNSNIVLASYDSSAIHESRQLSGPTSHPVYSGPPQQQQQQLQQQQQYGDTYSAASAYSAVPTTAGYPGQYQTSYAPTGQGPAYTSSQAPGYPAATTSEPPAASYMYAGANYPPYNDGRADPRYRPTYDTETDYSAGSAYPPTSAAPDPRLPTMDARYGAEPGYPDHRQPRQQQQREREQHRRR
jgi:hypothetical protein